MNISTVLRARQRLITKLKFCIGYTCLIPTSRRFRSDFVRNKVYVRREPKMKPKIMTLDTPEFKEVITPEIRKLVALFQKYGYELRIAGGAVRDLLNGLKPTDIDFATTATPTQMKDMFNAENIRMLNMNGEKHGTITARIDDKENFECTTLRIDIRTDGRHAEVQWTTDWQLDALRRDLTINQLFLGLDGTVYDYYNGIEDLKNKRVRFVGSAPDRIQEDYLRILRYFRFFGRIVDDPNSHEEDTLQGIRENTEGLKNISGERIWTELRKIITGRHASSIFKVMHEVGVTPYMGFRDNMIMEEFEAVCEKTESLNPHPTTRLAALMDCPDEMYELNDRLKLSREELRNGIFIIERRSDTHELGTFRYCEDLHCDCTGTEPKTHDRICELLKYLGDTETLEIFRDWTPPKFPVNGRDLIERDIPKGPALAKTLKALRQVWKESNYTLDKEAILDRLEDIKPAKKKAKST